MGERKAHYHLRIQIPYAVDVQQQADDLARFCQEHAVDEVVLFVAGEEWNNGFLDDVELEKWYEVLRISKKALTAVGVTVSLNPWYTVLHADRGRSMGAETVFTPMVSPAGREAKTVASPACRVWQTHITHLYSRLATLGFRVIWIEDDFRYHNHTPLDWGGDFSRAMLGRFAAKIGGEVTREEVVAAILQPGTPHPWRTLWLETWRETQLDVVRQINEAVTAVDSGTLLGLMSSLPTSHSMEGRDWPHLFETMSNAGRVVHRPHFASYQDTARDSLARSSFVLDYQKQLRPHSLQVEVTPEIENFPMTPFSKSDTVTWGQMALAQLHGADALSLDLFPFTCSRLGDEPWVGSLLDRCRPGLDLLAQLFPPTKQSQGVGVLWRPDASLHAHTSSGASMSELYVPHTSAAALLQSLGIAVQARVGRVNCLWGQIVWAYSDEEIREILSGSVWLDGEAVAILQQRGFEAYLPVTHHYWWQRYSMNYSMEHPENESTGLQVGTWLSVNGFSRVAAQTGKPDAVVWTSVRNAVGKPMGCGLALGHNSLGGHVAASAWPLASEYEAYTLSFYRQKLVQNLVQVLAGDPAGSPVMTSGSAYTFPIDMENGEARHVAVFNASFDLQAPTVRIPQAGQIRDAHLLTPTAPPQSLALETRKDEAGLTVALGESLPFCGLAVLAVA